MHSLERKAFKEKGFSPFFITCLVKVVERKCWQEENPGKKHSERK
jgi:hypothetical protein